jgi:hypothetical protein
VKKLMIISFLLSSLSSIGFAAESLARLTAIRIDTTNRTTVTFTVVHGGACHTYRGVVTRSRYGNILSILDSELPRCTRPEIQYYTTSVTLSGVYRTSSFILNNRLYPQVHTSP